MLTMMMLTGGVRVHMICKVVSNKLHQDLQKLHHTCFAAKKRGSQRSPRDLVDLQAHEAGQEGDALEGQDTPAEISPRHICVRSCLSVNMLV